MARITEHLQDRPRDAIFWLDAALVAVIVLLVAIAIVASAWLFSIFFLSGFGAAAMVAAVPVKVVVRDIDLTFIYPPIPDRNFDWQATRSGYDEGDPIVHGRTPVIALADLLEQEIDREEVA